MNLKKLKKFAGLLLIFTLLVILWGAWVRISHSGDGCGKSWPLCAGDFIPKSAAKKTWIEYAHRLMSGLYGLVVIGLFAWSRKEGTPRPIAKICSGIFILMIIEALLGAKLVLFGLVGQNDSILRLITMAFHQMNSLLLTGTTFYLYMQADLQLNLQPKLEIPIKNSNLLPPNENKMAVSKKSTFTYLIFILVIAVMGTWASLSNTLHPSDSILDGLLKDFQENSNYLVRLRIFHPLVASIFCSCMVFFHWIRFQEKKQQIDLISAIVFLVVMIFGWMTLLLHAPVWMKLSHLLFAHLIWMFLINLKFDSSLRAE